jgi:hypothetical protein
MANKTLEVWYRYDDDYDGNVLCTKYEVLKHTPKGVWLKFGNNDKFVLKGARKRFACPDKDSALESFIARKYSQRKIVRRQVDRVEKAILSAQTIQAGLKPHRFTQVYTIGSFTHDYP